MDSKYKPVRSSARIANDQDPGAKKYYIQKARIAWLKEPAFKDWLELVPNDLNYVNCRICLTTLKAKRSSLLDHVTSKKHQEAAEEQGAQVILPPKPPKTSLKSPHGLIPIKMDTGNPLLFAAEETEEQVTVDDEDQIKIQFVSNFKNEDEDSADVEQMLYEPPSPKKAARENRFADKEIEELQKAKLKLEMQKLSVDLYRSRLEALKLEKELGLPKSEHTIQFAVYE